MFCSKCGTENPPASNFCQECGTPLTPVASPPPPPLPPPPKLATSRPRSVPISALWGAVGFGIGGAINGVLLWDMGWSLFRTSVIMGAIGGTVLGLVFRRRRRAVVSALAGAVGFGIGGAIWDMWGFSPFLSRMAS